MITLFLLGILHGALVITDYEISAIEPKRIVLPESGKKQKNK